MSNEQLRVLFAHNYYQQIGGEDEVVRAEVDLLRKHGHKVRLYSRSNDEIYGLARKIKTSLNVSYSKASKSSFVSEISAFRPDIVHIHNTFPLLTPSILDACLDLNIPVVQTLHNYRLICPGAMLMRNRRPCEDCVSSSAYHSVLHGCYRGSRIGSLAVARMVQVHRKRGTWKRKVDRFIVLSEFAKRKFVLAGLPREKFAVKPNFPATVGDCEYSLPRKQTALFVGRLSQEKGIETLLRAWAGIALNLSIVGDGPLSEMVERAHLSTVQYVGRLSPEDVSLQMLRASFLILPSEWYEGFPMVLVEAYSRGLAVIASRLGSLEELVEDGITGLHFEPGNAEDLAAKVGWATKHPEDMIKMGENARQVYEQRYTPERNYEILAGIYQGVITEQLRNENGCSRKQTKA